MSEQIRVSIVSLFACFLLAENVLKDINLIVDLPGIQEVEELKHNEDVEDYSEMSRGCEFIEGHRLTIILLIARVSVQPSTVYVFLSRVAILVFIHECHCLRIGRIIKFIWILRDNKLTKKGYCAHHT